jgi:hypothetical protein
LEFDKSTYHIYDVSCFLKKNKKLHATHSSKKQRTYERRPDHRRPIDKNTNANWDVNILIVYFNCFLVVN